MNPPKARNKATPGHPRPAILITRWLRGYAQGVVANNQVVGPCVRLCEPGGCPGRNRSRPPPPRETFGYVASSGSSRPLQIASTHREVAALSPEECCTHDPRLPCNRVPPPRVRLASAASSRSSLISSLNSRRSRRGMLRIRRGSRAATGKFAPCCTLRLPQSIPITTRPQ